MQCGQQRSAKAEGVVFRGLVMNRFLTWFCVLVTCCLGVPAAGQVKKSPSKQDLTTPSSNQATKDFRKAAILALIASGNFLDSLDREREQILEQKLLFDAAQDDARKYSEESNKATDLAEADATSKTDRELLHCLMVSNRLISEFENAILQKRLIVSLRSVPDTSDLFGISSNAHNVHDALKSILLNNSYNGKCPAEGTPKQ